MPDIVDAATRSRMMAGIRGTDTKPEIVIRRGLHARGYRFRLHARKLPGRPDIVLPRYRAVILVNGCFWHGHDCHLFREPFTRRAFWREKIASNRARDQVNLAKIAELDWRVLIVWECALKGKTSRPVESVITEISDWIRLSDSKLEIGGSS